MYAPVNRSGGKYRGKPATILSKDGRDFFDRVRRIALATRQASSWPTNPYAAKSVRVTVRVFNTKHDAGAFDIAVKDALQTVFYIDDEIVVGGEQLRPIIDKTKACQLEITVELLDRHSDAQARQIADQACRKAAEREIKRGKARLKSSRAARQLAFT